MVTLDAGAGYVGYSWSSGGTNQTEDNTNSSDVTALQTVAVSVTITDGNGCQGTSPLLNINIYPQPVVGPQNRINENIGDWIYTEWLKGLFQKESPFTYLISSILLANPSK